MLRALRLYYARALFQHLNFPKVVRDPTCFDNFFYFKICVAPQWRALCSTSQLPKMRPELMCVDTFYFKMCVPHNCVHLIQHLNFQKCSLRMRYFDAFYFKMCFAPQWCASCSFLICPDVSAPAALASLLFDPPEPRNIWKNSVFCEKFRDFPYLFAHLHLLSSDFLHL